MLAPVLDAKMEIGGCAIFQITWPSIKFFVPNLTLAEGQVFGIGCKIFTIAGPVILYGIFSSWVLGVIYWLGQAVGIL